MWAIGCCCLSGAVLLVRGGGISVHALVPFSLTRCHALHSDFKVASFSTGPRSTSVSVHLYMLSCLSLTERVENSTALEGIFSKWKHLVIRYVNSHEFRYPARKRLPVKDTWNSSVHHDEPHTVDFLTGRDRVIQWCKCNGGGSFTGSKNRVRHFSEILSHRDVTLKVSAPAAVRGGRGSLESCSDPDRGAARAPPGWSGGGAGHQRQLPRNLRQSSGEHGPGGGWRMSMFSILRRNWALRVSVVLNICVLLYVCAHFGSSGPWIEEPPTNWAAPLQSDTFGSVELVNGTQKGATSSALPATKDASGKAVHGVNSTSLARTRLPTTKSSLETVDNRGRNQTVNSSLPSARPTMSLKDAILCNEKSMIPRRAQRGDYWVLYNYVPMSMAVRCWESVTYTTHADYTFLDNLEPLLERWRAPISIAMHAPGTDFAATLDAIKYSRNCGSTLISQLVTFHVFFSSKHVPKLVPPSEKVASDTYNCSLGPPWVNVTFSKMYKNEKKLLYPVNVGRNIARESAATYYVCASDIELYPSPNLPAKFLEMIRKRDQPSLYKPNPKVFVLSIFEVDEKSQPPNNKTQLSQMLKAGTAIPFHKKLCSSCHNVPRSKEWQEAPETEGLHVFHVGKRTGSFVHWEPIFIGTNHEPLYDERLSWEGKSDKMPQGYALCVLDYDFLILDNAFLIHRPGIKIFKRDPHREMLTSKTNSLIKKIIVPELKILYGTRKGCAV